MSWGDSWGSSPGQSVLRLAKAFHDGETFGGQQPDRVELSSFGTFLEYRCRGRVIAKYTPPWMVAEIIARVIDGRPPRHGYGMYPAPVYYPVDHDQATVRHLAALGVKAERQYGGNPFLVFGADATGQTNYLTIEEWKALPKWVEPPPASRRPRPERFVNLTRPLFT